MKKDDKIITTALERFAKCEEFEAENREKALEDLRFSLGDQWDEAVRRARETDPSGARPCLTVDKVDQYVRQVVNDARQNRPAIKPRAKDEGADVETAEIMAGIVRHIEDQSSADIAYDTAVEMAARASFGYIRVVTDYADDDGFSQDIFIRAVPNPFSCYLDPASVEPDGSDARYGFAFEDIERKQFEADYPKADACDFERSGPDFSDWVKKDTVRIAEYFEVVETGVKVWQAQDGSASEEEIEGAISRTMKKRKVIWRKMTAREVLEEREWPGKYIPIVPTYGHIIDVAGKRITSSLVRPAMDPQRIYNFAASAFVERVALTPKTPYVATVKQIAGHEHIWDSANTGNYSVLPYNPDPQAPGAPQRQQAADIPSGWMAVMQSMERDVQSALGMYNASVGAPSNEKSGKAILARQHEADVSTFHIIDNLSRSIRQVGRIVIDLIPKIYDTDRVVRILGEDGAEDFAEINPTQEQARLDIHDNAGNKIKSIYNPGVGRYDVTVNVGPAYSTKRQEAADFMTQIVQSSPDLMPIIGDLMFKAMDMPHADDIAKRMKKMLPAPLQDEEEAPQVPPEMQQQMQQMSDQIQKLGAALEEASAQLDAKDMEFAAKNSEIRLKERELTIKEYEAETKRAQVMSSAMTPEQVQAMVVQTIQQLQTQGFDGTPEPTEQMQEQPPQGGFFTPEGIEQ